MILSYFNVLILFCFFFVFYHASHSYFTTFERELPHCLLHCINLTAKVTFLSNYCPCQMQRNTQTCAIVYQNLLAGWEEGGGGGMTLVLIRIQSLCCGPGSAGTDGAEERKWSQCEGDVPGASHCARAQLQSLRDKAPRRAGGGLLPPQRQISDNRHGQAHSLICSVV